MSARHVFAVLVVVVLGSLLVNTSAFSRPDMTFSDAGALLPEHGLAGDDGNDDDDDPNPGYIVGDDDNWDKPVAQGKQAAEHGLAGPALTEAGGSSSGVSELRVRVRVLWATWVILFVTR